MLQVKKEGVLLKKTDHVFENHGVLNPATISDGEFVHLFYRAVRHGNYSTIGYCKLKAPMEIVERKDAPVLFPEHNYEKQGVEDPRIVRIDDLYFITYTAYDGVTAAGALATSNDLQHFEKHGIITPQFTFHEFKHLAESGGGVSDKYFVFPGIGNRSKLEKKVLIWDKDVIFFPRRIQGDLSFLHRIRPGIQLVRIKELSELTQEFWRKYLFELRKFIVLDPKFGHDASYLGGGCPPIETEYGWVMIYHGVHDAPEGFIYTACAALLDLNEPQKELSRLPYPLFSPEYAWELKGEVNNVCFPTGTILKDEILYIYYGAADEQIACASVSFSALLMELLQNRI